MTKETNAEVSMAEKSAVYAASNLPVTWATIALQNVKVQQQIAKISYLQAFSSVKQQGVARFFSGYFAYTRRNMISSAISGPVMKVSEDFTKAQGFSPVEGAVVTTLAATAVETAFTAYTEGTELNATKALPKASRLETIKRTGRVLPLMGGRNAPFWAAAVAADLALKDQPDNMRVAGGLGSGMVAGVASMPADTTMTAVYGTTKGVLATAKEYGAKALLKGAPVRSVQIGLFTGATVWAKGYLDKREAVNQSGGAQRG